MFGWKALITASVIGFVCVPAYSQVQECRNARDDGQRIEACSRVIASRSSATELERALNARGLALKRQGRYKESLEDFNKLLALRPRVAAYYDNRQSVLKEMGRLREALIDANNAVSLAKNHAFVYHSRAGIHYALGNLRASIEDYSRAIEIAPQHAFRWFDRGTILIELGEYESAIRDLSQALYLDSNFNDARKWRGIALIRSRNLNSGIDDLREYLTREPTDELAIQTLKDSISDLSSTQSTQPTTVTQVLAGPPLAPTLRPSERRVALLFGNARYTNASALRNPLNDADTLASSLRQSGFQSVSVINDATHQMMISALREFSQTAHNADWAVVYFSGHGIELNGVNYMIPVDAKLKIDRDIQIETVNVGAALSAIESARKMKLVILDMCRDNPFKSQMMRTVSTRSVGAGLARMEPEAGMLIAYAAKHGEYALDGNGNMSPYVEALVARLNQRPQPEIRRLFDLVRDDVMDRTNRAQQPFTYGSLSGRDDFFFSMMK